MAPEYPTPTMLALDAVEVLYTGLLVQVFDLRTEAHDLLAEAERKHREADVMNARIMRMPLVRSRILRSAS